MFKLTTRVQKTSFLIQGQSVLAQSINYNEF